MYINEEKTLMAKPFFNLSKLKTLKVLLLCLIFFSTLFITSSFAATLKKNLHVRVTDNKVTAYTNVREIVRWWPKIKFAILEKELWNISFPSIKDKHQLLGPTAPINGKIYLAYSSFVMELDIQKAQFTNRYQILGEITDIKSRGNKLIIKTFYGVRGKVWDKEPLIVATPEQLQVVANFGTITNRDYQNIYMKRKDAEQLSNIIDRIYISSLLEKKYDLEKLEAVRQEYIKAVATDTTNPWYYIYLGLISDDIGKKVYSMVYLQKALEVYGLVFYDYFQLSTFYENISQYSLADKAFELGMKDFFGRGYTPEQLTSTQSLMNYTTWLIPAINKHKDKDVERTLLLMERFYQLAPYKDGNYNILNSVVKYLIDKGRLPEARQWKIRADSSRGFFFPGDYSLLLADIGLNMFLACMIAFLLFGVIYLIRDLSQFIEDMKHKKISYKQFFLRRYFTKRNIYSFVILYAFSLAMLGLSSNTLGLISKMVKEPASINSGTWGNYATVKYFSRDLGITPERNLFLAIANQQLKDYQKAKELYQTMSMPEAYNNLAIIYIKQNKKELAIKELKKALLIDKYMLEARYNLALIDPKAKEPKREEKVELLKKYYPHLPMLALPEEKYYRKAFYSGFTVQNFNPINIFLFNKFLKGTENTVIEFTRLITPVFIIFSLVIIMLLLSVFVPQTVVDTINHNYFRRFIGLFIPGISYNWKLFGPFIFAIWLGFGITNLFYFDLSFETIKPALGLLTTFAITDYSVLSPVSSFELPYSNEVGFLCSIFFVMLWIFNFFYVLISRRYTIE